MCDRGVLLGFSAVQSWRREDFPREFSHVSGEFCLLPSGYILNSVLWKMVDNDQYMDDLR